MGNDYPDERPATVKVTMRSSLVEFFLPRSDWSTLLATGTRSLEASLNTRYSLRELVNFVLNRCRCEVPLYERLQILVERNAGFPRAR